MTTRERWLATLNHERADRIPMDYRATEETTKKLLRYMGLNNLSEMFEKLHIGEVVTVSPRYIGPPIPPDQDVFGIGYENRDYGTGHYRNVVRHPLARYNSVKEIEANYQWARPDWYDYSVIPEQIKGKDECIIRGGQSEPFATYKHLRGTQQGYIDLIENPEMVHYCLDKLYDLCYENARCIYETIPGKVLWTWVAEDVGSQEGMLVSLTHIEEFFLPRMKRMIDLVHEAGAYVFHHSDGAVRENIPNMIEIGIDVLDPVQWRCKGMEREGLAQDFGDKLVFHGAMDNQQTLAYGSVADVWREVKENIRILGDGGGYILGPCHNFQVVSPPRRTLWLCMRQDMNMGGYSYGL